MSFYKDPNGALHCHVLGAGLFFCFSTDLQYVCCVQGKRVSIRLRVPRGDGRPSTALAPEASRQEFKGTSINALSANSLKPIAFDPTASAARRRQCVSMCCGRVLKVLGVNRMAGPQNPGAPKCKCVIRLHTLMLYWIYNPSCTNDIQPVHH